MWTPRVVHGDRHERVRAHRRVDHPRRPSSIAQLPPVSPRAANRYAPSAMSKLTLRLEAYEKDARQLIAAAQTLADERGNTEVEPLHLLYRLVEGTETVQDAIRRSGVDPTDVLVEAESEVRRLP